MPANWPCSTYIILIALLCADVLCQQAGCLCEADAVEASWPDGGLPLQIASAAKCLAEVQEVG